MAQLNILQTAYLGAESYLAGKAHSVYDLCWAGDRLYVGDYRHDRVRVFDENLCQVACVEGMPSPHGVAMDGHGCLFVATFVGNRVLKFDPHAREIPDWDRGLRAAGLIDRPLSMEIDGEGSIWLADYGTHCVIKADADGAPILQWAPGEAGEFLPHCVRQDARGRLWIADLGHHTIRCLSPAGDEIATWSDLPDDFVPLALCLLDGDLMLVCELNTTSLWLFDLEGNAIATWPRDGLPAGESITATNMAQADNGVLYLSEGEGNRIQKLSVADIIAQHGRGRE